MLSIKKRQTYLKKLGFYTGKIDKKEGPLTELAYKLFNIVFLNKSSTNYTSATDSKLIAVYKSYKKSVYMTADDWKFFPNFKLAEFKCTCKGKYCDGYNGKKKKCPMRLIMIAQYLRNYYDKSVSISSGVRCKKRNKEVGGVKYSKHLSFKAFDGRVSGVKAKVVIELLKKFPLVEYTYDINTNYFHVNI